jgi:hypothetical protein
VLPPPPHHHPPPSGAAPHHKNPRRRRRAPRPTRSPFPAGGKSLKESDVKKKRSNRRNDGEGWDWRGNGLDRAIGTWNRCVSDTCNRYVLASSSSSSSASSDLFFLALPESLPPSCRTLPLSLSLSLAHSLFILPLPLYPISRLSLSVTIARTPPFSLLPYDSVNRSSTNNMILNLRSEW